MSSETQRLWDWRGANGEMPPFASVSAATLDRDLTDAAAQWREMIASIVGDPDEPTFLNTIRALEFGRQAFDRVRELLQLYLTLASTSDVLDLHARVTPELSRLEDDMLLNPKLFERVDAVMHGSELGGLDPEQRRLVELVHARFVRAGARLQPTERDRLARINGKLAAAIARFQNNVMIEERDKHILVEEPAELDGIASQPIEGAAQLAAERGNPGAWAFANQRPVVMAVLGSARNRALRERVWRLWTTRCDLPGEQDNKPVMAEILRLRHEKARLLGYADFAQFALADRMLGSPGQAMRLLEEACARVRPATAAHLGELEELASTDGLDGQLEPWDRYYYEERLRQKRFGVNASELASYLGVDGVIGAGLAAASNLHGIEFQPVADAGTYHPDVRVVSVEKDGQRIGMLHIDLAGRSEKRGGSWQQQLQPFSEAGTIPVCIVVTSVPPGSNGRPSLMTWPHAVVFFHELGHALHMLLARARYPSIGSMAVPWDFIELPALLNERWIEDRNLLRRYLNHWQTGEPIPDSLLNGVFSAARHDRVFSVTLDYLAGAIIDLKLHQLKNGASPDPTEVERETLKSLGMPHAIDQTMRPPHFFHIFSNAYAAGVYSYLLGDVLAADVAEAFLGSDGGLYDEATAKRWRDSLLSIGAREPLDAAYRRFAGRDPQPDALFRRFGLVEDAGAA